MLKRVDVATYQTLSDGLAGKFTAGVISLGLAEGGVDWVQDEHNAGLVTDELRSAVETAKADIIAGKIVVHDYNSDSTCPGLRAPLADDITFERPARLRFDGPTVPRKPRGLQGSHRKHQYRRRRQMLPRVSAKTTLQQKDGSHEPTQGPREISQHAGGREQDAGNGGGNR